MSRREWAEDLALVLGVGLILAGLVSLAGWPWTFLVSGSALSVLGILLARERISRPPRRNQ
jgi:hypothetical protein